MKKRLWSVFPLLAMVLGLLPVMSLAASAAEGIPYISYTVEGTAAIRHDDRVCTNYEIVTGSTTTFENGRWYVVSGGNVTVESRITVNGTANLILCDGAALNARAGINIDVGNNTLNIYGQNAGSGQLIAQGNGQNAGIGGYEGRAGGRLNVHGGRITAQGGNYAAGIGSGSDMGLSYMDPYGITLNAYGGEITATGGTDAAGIGGGRNSNGGDINFYGSQITAIAGSGNGYAVGGGYTGEDYFLTDNGHVSVGKNVSYVIGNDAYNIVETGNGDGFSDYLFNVDDDAFGYRYFKATRTDLPSVGYVSKELGTDNTVQAVDRVCINYEILKSDITTIGANNWYVVTENTSLNSLLNVKGTANLIVSDDVVLTANAGINVFKGNTLNIYTQSKGSGKIDSHGSEGQSGIGAGSNGTGGKIVIHGGIINSTGGDAPGLSGGSCGTGGDVIIYDGTVTATGQGDNPGIGGGNYGGNVVIYGGNVTAIGGPGEFDRIPFAIGSGYHGNVRNYSGKLTLGDGVTFAAGTGKDNCTVFGSKYNAEDAFGHNYFTTPYIHEHSYQEAAGEQYLASQATCTEAAVYYKSCVHCGAAGKETFTAGEPSGHSFKVTWDGQNTDKHQLICTKCKAAEYRDHVYDREVEDEKYLKNEAGCTEGNLYYKSCECGKASDTDTFETGKALGHQFPQTGEKYNDKEHKFTCRVCDSVKYEAHVWDDGKVTREATHLEEGVMTYTCSICGDNRTEPIGKLKEHTYDQESTDVKYRKSPADCENAAVYYKSCKCGEASDTEVFSAGKALGHKWQEATCETPKTCSVCKATEGKASGHDYGTWTSVSDTQHRRVCKNDPSHVETEDHELKDYSCVNCGYQVPEYTVSFDMNGHGKAASDQLVRKGDKAVKPEDPTEKRWTFLGWYTDSSCETEYDFDTAIEQDTVIHAKWVKDTSEIGGEWVKSSKGWWYSCSDGSYLAEGIYEIDGVNYAFNEKGYMVTGWYKDTYEGGSSNWYHFASSGAMEYGWIKAGTKWYYMDPEDGFMWAGNEGEGFFFEIEGKEYCLAESGAMVTGWFKVTYFGCTDWYHFSSSGVKDYGWLKDGTKWYYLDPDNNGIMLVHALRTIGGKNYCFDESGAMVTGWFGCDDHVSVRWVHATSTGALDTAKWVGDYYVNDIGFMVISSYVMNGDKYYWVNKDGKYTGTYSREDVEKDTTVYDIYDQATGRRVTVE